MNDLKSELDVVYELNKLRDRAKELREQGRLALEEREKTRAQKRRKEKSKLNDYKHWISSENHVEWALLVKVLNHRDMSGDDDQNDISDAPPLLMEKLLDLRLEGLVPSSESPIGEDDSKNDRSIPVLVAARVMQALVTRSNTVFSRASMVCYYRIVRELYTAAPPDWTIGAARAGIGGNTSAFITGECIRAIFGFEDAIKRTAKFFQQTHRLFGRFDLLSEMLAGYKEQPQPSRKAKHHTEPPTNLAIKEWANRTIERMWFDWYISTNPRHGSMALHLGELENQLLYNPTRTVGMNSIAQYKRGIRKKLKAAVRVVRTEINMAEKEIKSWDKERAAFLKQTIGAASLTQAQGSSTREGPRDLEKELRDRYRATTAHEFALSMIKNAKVEAREAAAILNNKDKSIKDVLEELRIRIERIANRIHRVLEPAKRYIRTVLNREVAASALGRFDAGELVFAAASFGAVTNWQQSELLTRACELLTQNLPESGRLPTTRPFQSTLRGHRMLPIGCEMTRSLAQVLQKIPYEIEPKIVRRLLNIFEERLITLDRSSEPESKKRVAWNFDGSPDPNTPCVWVTAVSVLAIDRVVRMLDERINSSIFQHFEVIRPEKPHSPLELNDLVYPDFGKTNQTSMALRLEQMRAHVMRVTLPAMYKDPKGQKERVFSAIFYGPPGTGKTTLIEALALSSVLPLIRVSTSDLVVQGPAAIEGQARTVFEALSMLTQVVVIFDEFEVVVGQRGLPGKKNEDVFEFLRTGMLPKLVKLHDAARQQSLVYCLATNHLDTIDAAAKRRGRFDFQLEVTYPDYLSRAGMLLYRIQRVVQRLKADRRNAFQKKLAGVRTRCAELIELTGGIQTNRLAEDYFRLPNWVIDHDMARPKNYKGDIPFLWYALKGEDEGYETKREMLEQEKRETKVDRAVGNAVDPWSA